jgi:hypothetical protein
MTVGAPLGQSSSKPFREGRQLALSRQPGYYSCDQQLMTFNFPDCGNCFVFSTNADPKPWRHSQAFAKELSQELSVPSAPLHDPGSNPATTRIWKSNYAGQRRVLEGPKSLQPAPGGRESTVFYSAAVRYSSHISVECKAVHYGFQLETPVFASGGETATPRLNT